MTEWRNVEGWPYEVSDDGEVRRKGSVNSLRPGYDKQTCYWKVTLCNAPRARQVTFSIHSLVATAFLGPCPPGMEVNHKDSNRSNSALSNLEYVTHLENVRHSVRLDRHPKGERNGRSKLTESQVLEIYKLHSEGMNASQLARQFHITYGGMLDIVTGKNWKYLWKENAANE